MSRIAVVGAGIAGVSAAWELQKKHQVSLFEAEPEIGGHAHTVEVQDSQLGKIGVDLGFIVLNNKNYPNFHRLLEQLQVSWKWSDMSFAYDGEGMCYAGTDLNGIFADRSNLLRPSFYSFFWELFRFCRKGLEDLDTLSDISLGEYLKLRKVSQRLVKHYVLPMGSAIWSVSEAGMLNYPAKAFLSFFKNHGLLSLKDRPEWQTIAGGSREYLNAFEQKFTGTVRKSAPVFSISRDESGVELAIKGSKERFDYVVLAVHADRVLKLLDVPTIKETKVFEAWQYSKNKVVLHTDESLLSSNKRAWASWNYCRENGLSKTDLPAISYHMNRLQGIKSNTNYIVTLNSEVQKEKVIKEVMFDHPIYTKESMGTHPMLGELQGESHTFYCGAYFGYGFHEDGCSSGVEVATRINAL